MTANADAPGKLEFKVPELVSTKSQLSTGAGSAGLLLIRHSSSTVGESTRRPWSPTCTIFTPSPGPGSKSSGGPASTAVPPVPPELPEVVEDEAAPELEPAPVLPLPAVAELPDEPWPALPSTVPLQAGSARTNTTSARASVFTAGIVEPAAEVVAAQISQHIDGRG